MTLTPNSNAGSSQQKAVVDGKPFNTSMELPALPSSLTLGIAGGDTIWTWSGRAGPVRFTIPDFAEQANAYLERLAQEGEGEGSGEGAGSGLVELALTLTAVRGRG